MQQYGSAPRDFIAWWRKVNERLEAAGRAPAHFGPAWRLYKLGRSREEDERAAYEEAMEQIEKGRMPKEVGL